MQNARFLTGSGDAAGELQHGLRAGLRYVYCGEEKRLPWSTTYLDLEALPFVRRAPHDRFGWPVYRFDLPLVLGTLEIAGLQVNAPNPAHQPDFRSDVPIDHFSFEIRLTGDGADNYWRVKAYFNMALGPARKGWEREDQLHAEWHDDGLVIGLTYWLQSYLGRGESGFASLHIANERIFPGYFTDPYVDTFASEQPQVTYRTFDIPHVQVPRDYRRSHWVRFTPAPWRPLFARTPTCLVIWQDILNGKVGFAENEQFCKIMDVTDHQFFILHTIDHDRGQYSHALRAVRHDAREETVLTGPVGTLDPVAAFLEECRFTVARKTD